MILSIDEVWDTQLQETKTLGKIFWFGLCGLEVAPEQDVVPCAQEASCIVWAGKLGQKLGADLFVRTPAI